jgi:hypothetical protein
MITCGLARGTNRDYEQGRQSPTLASAGKLRALGVRVDALLADGQGTGRARRKRKKGGK